MLRDHIKEIPHQESKKIKEFVVWIKNPSEKTEAPLQQEEYVLGSLGKSLTDINDMENLSLPESQFITRLASLASRNPKVEEGDADKALCLLGKLCQGKKIDPSIGDNKEITLTNFRKEAHNKSKSTQGKKSKSTQEEPQSTQKEKDLFDHLLKTAGFKIVSNEVRGQKKK